MTSSIISLIIFAIFMTGSPGPANLLMMMAGSSSLSFYRSVKFLFGLLIGKLFVHIIIGVGLGVFIVENKIIFEFLKYISSIYIIYLAFSSLKNISGTPNLSKFRFKNGLLVHPLSPKSWSMILLAQSQISDLALSQFERSLIIWIIFTLGQIIFHSSWGIFGKILGKVFNDNIWVKRAIFGVTVLFVIWFLLT